MEGGYSLLNKTMLYSTQILSGPFSFGGYFEIDRLPTGLSNTTDPGLHMKLRGGFVSTRRRLLTLIGLTLDPLVV